MSVPAIASSAPPTDLLEKSEVSPPQTPLLDLTDELLWEILSRCSGKDVISASLTCKRLFPIGNDNLLWKHLFRHTFPLRFNLSPQPAHSLTWKDQYRRAAIWNTNIIKGIYREIPLGGHARRITSLADIGDHLFTSSVEGKLIIWQKDESGHFQQMLTLDDCEGGNFNLSSSGNYLAYASDITLKVLRKEVFGNFALLQTSPGDGSKITQLKIEDDYLFTRSANGTFTFWKKDPTGQFTQTGTIPNCQQFTFQEDHLFVKLNDGATDIWKRETDGFVQAQRLLDEMPDNLPGCGLQYGSGALLMAEYSGKLKLWTKTEEFKETQTLNVSSSFMDPVTAVFFNGEHIITGTLKGAVTIIRKGEDGTFNKIQLMTDLKERINGISLKNGFLLIGSTDGSTGLWKKEASGNFTLLQLLKDEDRGVTGVMIGPDQFFSGYSDGSIKIWDFCKN